MKLSFQRFKRFKFDFIPYTLDKFKLDGFIIDRPKFFRYIRDEFIKMGGELENTRINSILQGKNFIKLKTDDNKIIKTKYVIAADGANSIVRKQLKIGEIYKTLVTQYIVDQESEHGVLKFFYDEKYAGDYKYIFPNGNTTRIGFPLIEGKKFKIDGKIIKKQTRVVGCGGLKKYVYGNILLIGDAAGQTNILSKGGIRPGMYAGKIAAETVVNNNPGQYETNWMKSGFHNENMMKVFKRLKKMDNSEIMEHYEPFKGNKKITGFIKTLILKKYKKYNEIYNAYRYLEKYGW